MAWYSPGARADASSVAATSAHAPADTVPVPGVTRSQRMGGAIRTARPENGYVVLCETVRPSFRSPFWTPTVMPVKVAPTVWYWKRIVPSGWRTISKLCGTGVKTPNGRTSLNWTMSRVPSLWYHAADPPPKMRSSQNAAIRFPGTSGPALGSGWFTNVVALLVKLIQPLLQTRNEENAPS